MIWGLLVLATIVVSNLRGTAGQGLDVDLSEFLGADNRLTSQRSQWTRDTQSARGLLQSWAAGRRSSKSCTGTSPDANLCGVSAITKADAPILLVASSPAIYDTRNSTQNRGLYIAPEPRNQGVCNACVAYAMAAASQSAAAAVLQLNSSKVPFPSPRQLFFCGGDTPDCTTGWKLQEAVQVLDSSSSWAKDGLYSYDCMSMSEVTNELPRQEYCKPSCSTKFPPGIFTYTKAYPLQEIWQIQQHIRAYGASVVTRMTLPPGFKEYYTTRKTAVYDNPTASKNFSKVGSGENHAVVIAGYNNVESYWIIWSSWGKDWADGGFGRVRYNQLGIADPSFTYGVIFLPKQPPPPPYKLIPDKMLPTGCYWYQALQGDYVSRVARILGMPIQLLLNLNLGRIEGLGDWLQPGAKLLVCGVKNVTQNASQAPPAQTSPPTASTPTLAGLAPALQWTSGSFNYQLYKPARTWRQAESSCTQLGSGWHLASINSDQDYNMISNYLVYANKSAYSHGGGGFLVGCGDGKEAYPTVWTGLHDPKKLNQSRATWQTVADTFVWSDGSKSPFLSDHPNDYFTPGPEKQEEYCIGFTFCSRQDSLAKLDKHPCEWEMSFLCKGPA